MRSGKRRASSKPASHAHGGQRQRGLTGPRSDRAPQKAEPMAKAPSAHSVCIAVARARTQGGTLVCVAVLKVDITAIQAPPPRISAA
jgi:hypothetical protein